MSGRLTNQEKKNRIEQFLRNKPGYLKKSKDYLSKKFKVTPTLIKEVIANIKPTLDNLPYKRLFFDIETSPNVVLSWNVGNKINLSYDNIIQERAVICICYKWAHEDTVHHLSWNKGDDKEMLIKFIKIMNEANQIVAHNGDNYDVKWLRSRCVFHNIPMMPNYDTIDTLKLSRTGFRFNSNRLDYIGKYLGLKGKTETGYDLWKDIVLNDCKVSMIKMITYCKRDVELLEKVYNKLNPYTKHKVHFGVAAGNGRISCPECTSINLRRDGLRYSAAGTVSQKIQCNDCHKYFTVPLSLYNKSLK
jgi:DNA polymerase elongation subunit (family B)